MNARHIPALAEPTMEERAIAAEAARALRRSIEDRSSRGDESTVHIDYAASRQKGGDWLPKRAEWITRWENLPGFCRVNGRYEHACLPGWVYSWPEVRREMIPDLEALAEQGIRPTEVTS